MKTKFYQIALLCIAFLGMANVVNAQTLTEDLYDSFDRGTSISQTAVVTDNSVRQYSIPGDTDSSASTFVWKIQGGVFVTDASGTANITGAVDLTNNAWSYTVTGDGSNSSSLYVKWDNVDATSYVAVYEQTSYGCYNALSPFRGFKISVSTQLEIWLAENQTDICSEDNGIVRIELPNPANSISNGTNYFYPMSVNYTVTDKAGTPIAGSPFTLTLETTHAIVGTDAESTRYFHTLDRGQLIVGAIDTDDFYTITLTNVTDPFSAAGSISNNGTDKFESHKIDVRHLPQTGIMVQN